MPSVGEFRFAIRSQFREAESRGLPHIEIKSGKLHREVGGYPGPEARMPSCCEAMYDEQKAGDEIISRPPKGKGASLTIRYRLPRSAVTVSKGPWLEKPPVNVVAHGISSGLKVIGSARRLNVGGHDFELMCEIKPQKNPDGT